MRTKMWLGYIHKPRVGERNRNEIAQTKTAISIYFSE